MNLATIGTHYLLDSKAYQTYKMFKLFLFAAILAFAAAAPGNIATPFLASSYASPYFAAPLAYSGYSAPAYTASAYSAPAYGYAASFAYPYAYAAKPTYLI